MQVLPARGANTDRSTAIPVVEYGSSDLHDPPNIGGASCDSSPQTRPRLTCRYCPVRDRAPCAALPGDAGAETLEGAHAPLRHVPAGASIFEQGAPSDRSFTLLSGWAALCHTSGEGRTVILHFALPGEVLGFDRHSPIANRSAVAVGDATVCSISRTRQERLEREHPSFDARHKANAGRDLDLAYETLTAMATGSARERIAYLAWDVGSRSLARRPRSGDRIYAPLSQIQVGLATGLTPVHVSRTLRALREERVLTLEDRTLLIHDAAALEHLAGASPEALTRRT
jgi:CRP/FNR family transcriptional regulator